MTIYPYKSTASGTAISTYHARMVGEQDIQPATVVTYSDWQRQSINPLFYGTKEEFTLIKVSLRIEDATRAACALDISNLCAALRQCTVKFTNEPYYYDCQMSDTPVRTRKWGDTKWQVDISLQASYAYLPAVTVPLTSTLQTVTAQGNLPSPAVVTLTPTQDIGAVTLTGLSKKPIKVLNLHAGAPVTIDGEACTVTEPDLDTIMTEDMGAGKWMLRKYMMPSMFSPDTINADFIPTKSIIPADASYTQRLIPDSTNLYQDYANNFLLHLKTGLNVASAKSITLKFLHDDGVNIILNGTSVYSHASAEDNNGNPGYPSVSLPLAAGWNRLEILVLNHYGVGGIWGIQTALTSQVGSLNAYHARDSAPEGVVNKFPDTDMWEWPVVQPGTQTVTTSIPLAVCGVEIKYKPKFI